MLDPREQKKGGFGAFAAREQERHDVRAAAAAQAAQSPATGPASVTAPAAEVARAEKTTVRAGGAG